MYSGPTPHNRIADTPMQQSYRPPPAAEAEAAMAAIEERTQAELVDLGRRLMREGVPPVPSNLEMAAYIAAAKVEPVWCWLIEQQTLIRSLFHG